MNTRYLLVLLALFGTVAAQENPPTDEQNTETADQAPPAPVEEDGLESLTGEETDAEVTAGEVTTGEATAGNEQQRQGNLERFKPSEEISLDRSVAFPNDI